MFSQYTPVDSIATVVMLQPSAYLAQVTGKAVESAVVFAVAVFRYTNLHLAISDIDACSIGINNL